VLHQSCENISQQLHNSRFENDASLLDGSVSGVEVYGNETNDNAKLPGRTIAAFDARRDSALPAFADSHHHQKRRPAPPLMLSSSFWP